MIRVVREIGFTIGLMFICSSAFGEILTLESGMEIKGRVGELNANIVKFYADRYYALELTSIRDARIDDGVVGKEAKAQQARVDRLLFVLDQTDFLRSDFKEHVKQLLVDRQFDKLDALARKALDKNLKYPSGVWKQLDIYRGVVDDIQWRDTAGFEKRTNLVKEWIKQKPASVAAKIALMTVNVSYAWAYRGGGVSSTVTQTGRWNFREKLREVIKTGESLRAMNANDPSLYIYLIIANNALGSSNQIIIKLAAESEKIAPDYYPVYYQVMVALLPKWGGSLALTREFLQTLVDSQILRQTPEMYYQLIALIKTDIKDEEYGYYGFDWALIQKSFAAYRKKYHVTDGDMHLMAKLAALHGDRETARQYFSATSGQWNHFAISEWQEKPVLEKFISWSKESPDPDYSVALLAVLSANGRSNPIDLINAFIKAGGDINRQDVLGNTLLHHAVKRRRIKVIGQLLAAGAKADVYNSYGFTPLHIAAMENEPLICQMLIAGGADIQLGTGSYQNTAAHLAADRGYTTVLKVLLHGAGSLGNSQNKGGQTPLHLAAKGGYVPATEALLSVSNINVNAQANSGDTPLHLAVARGHPKTASILLKAGADPDLKNLLKHTALSLAKEKGFTGIELILKNAGASDSHNVISKSDQDKAYELYKEASKYFNQKDYKKARELYQKAIEFNDSFAIAYHSLAIVNWEFTRNYEEANRNIVKAIALDPEYAENYYIAGRINYSLNRPEKYKAYFQRYVKMAPDTYNTKDLKANYAQLLTNEKPQRKHSQQTVKAVNLVNTSPQQTWVQANYRYLALAAVLLLLMLIIRIRQSKKPGE